MEKIRVNTDKPYDVMICHGEYGICDYLNSVGFSGKIAVITDDNVGAIYGDRFVSSLNDADYDVFVFSFAAGEGSKNLKTYGEILSFLAECEFDRSDIIISLGGGVTGDIAGFAAATYMRGIGYIEVPTTLLAMVDASVGGKTAVDLPEGKNLVGAFHQPMLTLCNTEYLATLDKSSYSDGLTEALKCGVIGDKELFDAVNTEGDIVEIIKRSVKLKAEIVSEDEFEKGKRALLNLGHTVGHAIEKLSGYTVSHGRAVGIGLAVTTRASYKSGYCSEKTFDSIISAIRKINPDDSIPYGTDEIISVIKNDKKRQGETYKYIVIRDIGICTAEKFDAAGLCGFLRRGIG